MLTAIIWLYNLSPAQLLVGYWSLVGVGYCVAKAYDLRVAAKAFDPKTKANSHVT